MGLCKKCNKMVPPGFIPEGNEICIFCERDVKELPYKNKMITKDEIVSEYDIFLKIVKEKNDVLRKAVRGDFSEIPEKLLVD